MFQLFGDFDINVSDVLEVFSAISRHSRSNGVLEIRSQEAKDILASEKGNNLVNALFNRATLKLPLYFRCTLLQIKIYSCRNFSICPMEFHIFVISAMCGFKSYSFISRFCVVQK